MIEEELKAHRISRDSDYDDGVYVGPRYEQQPISISEMVAHIASEKELRRPIYSMTPDYAERMIQLEAEVHVLKQKVANLCDTIAALIDVIDQRSETQR